VNKALADEMRHVVEDGLKVGFDIRITVAFAVALVAKICPMLANELKEDPGILGQRSDPKMDRFGKNYLVSVRIADMTY